MFLFFYDSINASLLQAAQQISNIFNKHFEAVIKIRDTVVDSKSEFKRFDSDSFADLGVQRCCYVDESDLELIAELGRKVSTNIAYDI